MTVDYDPATVPSDPRVCRICAERHEDATWWPILNTRSGKYHSDGYEMSGVTDCGRDATGAHWVWPM